MSYLPRFMTFWTMLCQYWVDNTGNVLAYLFNSASRQHYEVWASEFTFLHSIKDSIPPSEACLYGCINWSLVQVHHHSSLGLSQSLTSLQGARARPRAGFRFNVQKQPVMEFDHASLPEKSHLDPVLNACQGGRKSVGGTLTSSTDSRKKKCHGNVILDVSQSSSSSFSSIVQMCTLTEFLDQWRSITFNRFMLNMVKSHYVQLRHHPPLSHNFRWFNIQATPVQHSVFQEVHELFAKGVVEPSSDGLVFTPNICVVAKHTGGLQSILNLKQFNHYMHIPTFKMPTNKQVWLLIQHGNLKDVYLHILIVKHHHCFLWFVWQHKPYQWKIW